MTVTAERPVDDATPQQRDERARAFAALIGKVADPYDPAANPETFDLELYLARFDPRLLGDPGGRRALCRLDPMLFALTYMRKHLKDDEGRISFADAHFLWVRAARRWIGPARGQREDRRAFVAPRACGKSTWWFLILPMWAGAFGHARFAAAFADSGSQAELHLATFKAEMADNVLLMTDFPDYCAPARRHTGRTVADNQNMLHTRSGFTFVAKGIDATSLGMKMGEVRPDLLIFDDIEPPEATYSPYQREKRLSTVENAILPLNERARVTIVGTVTMPGSIIHELVRHAKGEPVEPWVDEQRIKTFHTRPIVKRPDGTERSVWPQKWPLAYLQSIRHTRSYKLNFDNDPKGRQGDYWSAEDIHYGTLPNMTQMFLFVDPPVTVKTHSDFCGITLVGYAPGTGKTPERDLVSKFGRTTLAETLFESEVADGKPTRLPRVAILDGWNVKLTGAKLREFILGILKQYPQVKAIVLENNQGGSLWNEVFHDMPVRFKTYPSRESKEVRFARALDFCQKRRVVFAKVIPALEDQLLGFPKIANDDFLDSTCAGILRLLTPRLAQKDGTVRPS